MLNLNYNINDALDGKGCIGVMKYNYSASILVAGGGAGIPPLTASQARGGGGAGFVWTGSLSIIPNISYQILVAETSSLGGVGNESKFIGFDDNDTIPFTVTSLGGQIQTGPNASGTYDGGVQGSGSFVRAATTTSYAGFIGGLGTAGSRGGFPNFVGGGGAGARGNGGNGDINAAPGAQGGIGGIGYDTADFNPIGPGQSGIIAAGGSGESIGGAAAPQTIRPSEYSQGASYNGTVGAKGGIVIKYAGEPKAFVTNATTVTIGGFTYHTFNTGTGSFIFTYPYPWSDVVPYQVEECFGQRHVNTFNYDASIVVVGGGGGGASVNGTTNPYVPGGGGGAGAAVSASVSIIPNLPYTVIIGQSGSRDMDGSDSIVTGWDGSDSQTLGMFAQGGRKGVLSTGGNAGSGSVVRTTTINFPATTGGTGGGSYPNLTAGGGGGALSNGGNGNASDSGDGGTGLTTETILVAYAAGAGGGAGDNTTDGGAGLPSALNSGGEYQGNGDSAVYYGNGGGGAGAEAAGGGDSFGGNGSPGAVVFKYSGTQKAFGGTISYDGGANQTTHLFTSSGQFLYTYPYPW